MTESEAGGSTGAPAPANDLVSQVRAPVTIGVVGPPDVVQRVLSLDTVVDSGVRLIGATHQGNEEIVPRAVEVSAEATIILFTGPLQYDLAADQVGVPSTFVPLSGTSLFSALLRASTHPGIDLDRVSIDSLPLDEVTEAYADIGRDPDQLHVAPYRGPRSVQAFARFHAERYRSGASTAALTTVKAVATQLEAESIPVIRMAPTTASLRSALTASALLGNGSLLEASRLVLITVEVQAPQDAGTWAWSNYRLQAVRLDAHRVLLEEVEEAGAALMANEGLTFAITATAGAVQQLTDDLHVAPFVDRLEAALGLPALVGIGSGRTVREADQHAQQAIALARSHPGHPAQVVGTDGTVVGLPPRARRSAPIRAADHRPERELLRRIVADLPTSEGPLVVDASQVAEVLSVTLRSARRTLQTLVAAGLAWPMPPAHSPGGGRPRRRFRLLVQRLHGHAS